MSCRLLRVTILLFLPLQPPILRILVQICSSVAAVLEQAQIFSPYHVCSSPSSELSGLWTIFGLRIICATTFSDSHVV